MYKDKLCLRASTCPDQVSYVPAKAQEFKDKLGKDLKGILNSNGSFASLSTEQREYLKPMLYGKSAVSRTSLRLLDLIASTPGVPLPGPSALKDLEEAHCAWKINENADLKKILEEFFATGKAILAHINFWDELYRYITGHDYQRTALLLTCFSELFTPDTLFFIEVVNEQGFNRTVESKLTGKRDPAGRLLLLLNCMDGVDEKDKKRFISLLLNEPYLWERLEILTQNLARKTEQKLLKNLFSDAELNKDNMLRHFLYLLFDIKEDVREKMFRHYFFLNDQMDGDPDFIRALKSFVLSSEFAFMTYDQPLAVLRRLNTFLDILGLISRYYPKITDASPNLLYQGLFICIRQEARMQRGFDTVDRVISHARYDFRKFPMDMLEWLFFKDGAPLLLFRNREAWNPQIFDFTEWIISGKRIRDYTNLPFALTKEDVHGFYTLFPKPNAVPVIRCHLLFYAFLAVKIRKITRRDTVSDAIMRVISPEVTIPLGFIEELAGFFQKYHYKLIDHEIRDIVDYAVRKKSREPAYTPRKATLQSMRRRVEAWHEEIREQEFSRMLERKYGMFDKRVLSWKGIDLPDFTMGAQVPKYEFRQIKQARELYEEGKAMHHCVFTYMDLCIDGDTSIWSFRELNMDGVIRLLTIELDRKQIVQIKGKYNRNYTPEEIRKVAVWARENRITFAQQFKKYLLPG